MVRPPFLRHLRTFAILLSCIVFSACFEIPNEPKSQAAIKSIEVKVLQSGEESTDILKIKPYESAELYAEVKPTKYNGKLAFSWCSSENQGQVLGTGKSFTITGSITQELPNRLLISDEVGNQTYKDFELIVNAAPQIKSIESPLENDTLKGDQNTAFKFSWVSTDENSKTLSNTIIIDDKTYDVYELNQIWQSGFSRGKHTFQVVVEDAYGDKDSSDVIKFYVFE